MLADAIALEAMTVVVSIIRGYIYVVDVSAKNNNINNVCCGVCPMQHVSYEACRWDINIHTLYPNFRGYQGWSRIPVRKNVIIKKNCKGSRGILYAILKLWTQNYEIF